MKRILFVLAISFIGEQAFSQTVNDVPIKDIDASYVQIVGYSKLFSSKLQITIDFGQETNMWNKGMKTTLRDANRKTMSFNSMIDALNFMNDNGYEFETAYALSIGNQNVYHFLLKKKGLRTIEQSNNTISSPSNTNLESTSHNERIKKLENRKIQLKEFLDWDKITQAEYEAEIKKVDELIQQLKQ